MVICPHTRLPSFAHYSSLSAIHCCTYRYLERYQRRLSCRTNRCLQRAHNHLNQRRRQTICCAWTIQRLSNHFLGPAAIHSFTFSKLWCELVSFRGERISCWPTPIAHLCTRFSNYWKSYAITKMKWPKRAWRISACTWRMWRCQASIPCFRNTIVSFCRRRICGNKMHKISSETQTYSRLYFIIM